MSQPSRKVSSLCLNVTLSYKNSENIFKIVSFSEDAIFSIILPHIFNYFRKIFILFEIAHQMNITGEILSIK